MNDSIARCYSCSGPARTWAGLFLVDDDLGRSTSNETAGLRHSSPGILSDKDYRGTAIILSIDTVFLMTTDVRSDM